MHPKKAHQLIRGDSQQLDREVKKLQDEAAMLLATLRSAEKSCASCVLEDLTDTFTSLCRALEIVLSANLLGDCHTLRRRIDISQRSCLGAVM